MSRPTDEQIFSALRRTGDIIRRLKEFSDWMVSSACGNVPDEATLLDEAAREIEELVREVSIWRGRAGIVQRLEQVGVVTEAGDHIDVSIDDDILWTVGEKLYRFKEGEA